MSDVHHITSPSSLEAALLSEEDGGAANLRSLQSSTATVRRSCIDRDSEEASHLSSFRTRLALNVMNDSGFDRLTFHMQNLPQTPKSVLKD